MDYFGKIFTFNFYDTVYNAFQIQEFLDIKKNFSFFLLIKLIIFIQILLMIISIIGKGVLKLNLFIYHKKNEYINEFYKDENF